MNTPFPPLSLHPNAHVLDAAVHLICSFSSSQRSVNMHLCFGYISREGQQTNRQEWARQEQSSSGQTKSAERRAHGAPGRRIDQRAAGAIMRAGKYWQQGFEGPEEAREPKGSLVRSEVSFESVSSVCMLLEGRRVSLPESHVALQDSWIQPRIHG